MEVEEGQSHDTPQIWGNLPPPAVQKKMSPKRGTFTRWRGRTFPVSAWMRTTICPRTGGWRLKAPVDGKLFFTPLTGQVGHRVKER
jgi:hypothetical protein